MSRLKNCNCCGEKLIEGQPYTASAFTDSFKCTIENIPIKVCPNYCPDKYWYHVDLGIEVFELLAIDKENIAKQKFSFFKFKENCRHCNSELIDRQETGIFQFKGSWNNGMPLKLSIQAPALTCSECQEKFIPNNNSKNAECHTKLGDVISKALTEHLVSE